MSTFPASSAHAGRRYLFVTGRLAEGIVRQVVQRLSSQLGFIYDVQVVGISVAALMHVSWLKRKLVIDGKYDSIFVPGWCQGDLHELEQHFGVPFSKGPRDVLDLANALGSQQQEPINLTPFDIQIIAEINHAPRFDQQSLLKLALDWQAAGADMIDLGCIPGESWSQIPDVVRLLRDHGMRVSVDSFDRSEVEAAVKSGAELVLSCNSTNLDWASQLGVELVVIPDDPERLDSMWETARVLQEQGVGYRLDPILEPIGFGFAASLARFHEARRLAPDVPMMMGIGNLTELTEVDSAGVNMLLAAICQELQIQSVLTTQVANWCRTAITEFESARRLVKYAIDHKTPPKRLSHDLVILRDPRVQELEDEALQQVARHLKDPNYRIFVERGEIHVMNRDGYWRGTDPFELFDAFWSSNQNLDAPHAFYLGYEFAKAVTALTLGKQYRQDQALSWGKFTVNEASAHERRRKRDAQPRAEIDSLASEEST